MKNTDSFSVIEKDLLLELERILVNHRYNCNKLESINTSNVTYMYRIKKALLKSKVEKKRIAVLESVIKSVNIKIERGMLFKEIFEPLPAIIQDELRNYSKNKKDENNIKKVKEVESMDNKAKEKQISKVEYVDGIINQILEKLEDYTREDLLRLESEYCDYIKNNTSDYGIAKANVEILGSSYIGLIESTRKNFEKLLQDSYRIRLKPSDKLSSAMSDELLKYRVAGLIYTNAMCKNRIKKIKPNMDDKIDFKAFWSLKEDVRFVGKVIRIKYQDEYGISPKDEIIENFVGGQLSFEGLLPERDEITRKRNK